MPSNRELKAPVILRTSIYIFALIMIFRCHFKLFYLSKVNGGTSFLILLYRLQKKISIKQHHTEIREISLLDLEIAS